MNVLVANRHRTRWHLFLTLVAVSATFGSLALHGHSSQAARAAVTPERISINDNRAPAGVLSDGVLTIRLEARLGKWHPDRDTDPGVVVKAFAIEGGSLQIPGPVIRVREGTQIRVRFRDTLNDPVALHGFYMRASPASGS